MNTKKIGYIDGFVLVVSKEKKDAYKKMAQSAADIWKRHGALSYIESIGDDLHPDTKGMPMMTFPRLTQLQDDEDVWFSFIGFASREHRDEVNAKVMAEMGDDCGDDAMPFDLERMSWGGFEVEIGI